MTKIYSDYGSPGDCVPSHLHLLCMGCGFSIVENFILFFFCGVFWVMGVYQLNPYIRILAVISCLLFFLQIRKRSELGLWVVC